MGRIRGRVPAGGYAMTEADFRSGFGVVDPTQMEIISKSLWERATYTSATTVSQAFFRTAPATPFAGNLGPNAVLDRDHFFLIKQIRYAPAPNVTEFTAVAANGNADGAAQDVTALIYNGIAELKILSKDYGEWPLWMLPAGGGPWGAISAPGTFGAGTTGQYQLAANGLPLIQNAYSLPVPLVIPELTRFQVNASWSAAQTLVGGNTPHYMLLDGILMRPRQ